MGLSGLKGALGTIRDEVMPTGEGDSAQLEVAMTADPSLGVLPSLLFNGRGAACRRSFPQPEPWGLPGPPSAAAPPSPAMLLSSPAQRGCKTAPCRILNVPR